MPKTQTNKKGLFYAKVKLLDISLSDQCAVVLNEKEAERHGIQAVGKVEILYKDKKTGEYISHTVNAHLSNELIDEGQIGVIPVEGGCMVENGDILGICYTTTSEVAIGAIRKKLLGHDVSEKEIRAIMKDITDNKLSNTMITYYVASGYIHETNKEELFWTSKAAADFGEKLKFKGIVADKHCIGGISGNETTMIIIPIIASLGIKIPKSFSKSITSPASTGECVRVLMDIARSKKEIYNLVEKNNSCLSRLGGLNLSPANYKIMKISHPLAMEPYSKMVASIMSNKYAMGVNHCLIDIPVGITAKVHRTKDVKEMKQDFELLGKRFGIKMDVQITDGTQPIGRGVGAVLEVREVLRILQQNSKRSMDLEKKSVFLASRIIELVGMAKGKKAYKLAYGQLASGGAWKEMQEIIQHQTKEIPETDRSNYFKGKARDLDSENILLGQYQEEIYANKSGIIKSINMHHIGSIARALGCPIEKQAGFYLNKKVGDKIKKGELLFTMYAHDKPKMKIAIDRLSEKKLYEIKSELSK